MFSAEPEKPSPSQTKLPRDPKSEEFVYYLEELTVVVANVVVQVDLGVVPLAFGSPETCAKDVTVVDAGVFC
jgi:hypothetical protein